MKSRTIQLLFFLAVVLAAYVVFRWDSIFLAEPAPAVPLEIEAPAAKQLPATTPERPRSEILADNGPSTDSSATLPPPEPSVETEEHRKGPGIIQPKSGFKQGSVDADQPRIIGGDVALGGAYPWSVALVKAGDGQLLLRQFCGGTLISPEWVITAAHCTFSGPTMRLAESFNVVLGTSTLDDGQGQEVAVSEIIRHPDYYRATATLDVALLRLAEPVSYPTIKLGDAALLTEVARASALTLGWGRTENLSRSNELRQVNVPLVDKAVCQAAYAKFNYTINDAMICAGYAEGGKDACVGDSGGPIVVPDLNIEPGETPDEWVLVGVVSWGRGCAQANAYGVYVDVGHVTDWINGHVADISTADYADSSAPTGRADGDVNDGEDKPVSGTVELAVEPALDVAPGTTEAILFLPVIR